MVDFKKLKENSQQSLDKLSEELEKLGGNNNTRTKDARFWYPDVDKAGNGFAVIRFLPAPPNEDVPFVRLWSHAFEGPSGWYIENSLTTLGQDDPVSEYNSKLWKSGVESDKEIARAQKRNLSFYANVYVISDKAHPENEGKVFLFKFGKKIYDKLNQAMKPEFEDEKPLNPFDLWTGANFKIKIRQVEGYRNYDASAFDAPGPLMSDDDELEKIWMSEHSLQDIIAPDKFKSYEELQKRLQKVITPKHGIVADSPSSSDNTNHSAPPPAHKEQKPSVIEIDDEDADDFFKALASDD